MLNFVAFFFLIVFIANVCCIYILKERKKIIKLKKKRSVAETPANISNYYKALHLKCFQAFWLYLKLIVSGKYIFPYLD